MRLNTSETSAADKATHRLAVDVARLLLVDEKQVALAWLAGDVDVLPHLDEAVGAEDRQPAVAPGRQPSGVNQSTRM